MFFLGISPYKMDHNNNVLANAFSSNARDGVAGRIETTAFLLVSEPKLLGL